MFLNTQIVIKPAPICRLPGFKYIRAFPVEPSTVIRPTHLGIPLAFTAEKVVVPVLVVRSFVDQHAFQVVCAPVVTETEVTREIRPF